MDAIPDIGENQQIVFTEWLGRSPQDVEDQITYPLTVSLLGIPGVKTIRSYSFFGFSSIYIIFEDGIDFYWSRSRVLEKLNSLPAGTLPEGVRAALGPDATGLRRVFWYTLEGRDEDGNPAGGWDLNELRTIQDWYVRSGLIHETLGTLNTALTEEILVTIIVVIVLVVHLRSSILISGLLPLAVLMCFIAMKVGGMTIEILTMLIVPVLYSSVKELKLKSKP